MLPPKVARGRPTRFASGTSAFVDLRFRLAQQPQSSRRRATEARAAAAAAALAAAPAAAAQ